MANMGIVFAGYVDRNGGKYPALINLNHGNIRIFMPKIEVILLFIYLN